MAIYNSVICEYPDCAQRKFYKFDWQVEPRKCFCSVVKKYMCSDHRKTSTTICSKCVTNTKNENYNYICHVNCSGNSYYNYFKITEDIYLVQECQGFSKNGRCWSICQRKRDNIFDIEKLYARELKPYTFIPLLENEMRQMPNNYANVLPRDIRP
jgi:hypothetical protein